jgi:hypothetical protein
LEGINRAELPRRAAWRRGGRGKEKDRRFSPGAAGEGKSRELSEVVGRVVGEVWSSWPVVKSCFVAEEEDSRR